MKVEILYFSGCPNHLSAIDRVREVLAQEGTAADIIEIEVKEAATAQQISFLGSPSIRVNGRVWKLRHVPRVPSELCAAPMLCAAPISIRIAVPEYHRRNGFERRYARQASRMRITEK